MTRYDVYRVAMQTLGVIGLCALAADSVRADPVGPQACGPSNGAVTCLQIDWVDPWLVHVGIDVPMPRWRAEQIMACNGNNPFWAEVWGNDDSDEYLFSLNVSPGWPAMGEENGLSCEFNKLVQPEDLDEDRGGDRDELYVRIYLRDCSGGRTIVREYTTKQVEHYF